jgi:hypothetical protein
MKGTAGLRTAQKEITRRLLLPAALDLWRADEAQVLEVLTASWVALLGK